MKDLYEMSVIFAGTVFLLSLMASPYVLLEPTTDGALGVLHTSNLEMPLILMILFSFIYTVIGLVFLRNQ